METMKSKVYVLLDKDNRIIRCEGGYTIQNIKNIDEWVLIDEGSGDRYNHCQSRYFPGGLYDNRGVCRYKYNGEPLERTQEEMDADVKTPDNTPSQLDIIEAQITYTAMMTDTLLEV